MFIKMYDRYVFDYFEFFMVVIIWVLIYVMYIYICWFLYVSYVYVLINECDRNVLFLWYLI